MPYLKEIVAAINTGLQSGKLRSTVFKSRYYGISQVGYVNNADETQDELPMLIDQAGNARFAGFDDSYSLSIYHRCIELAYDNEGEESQFGDTTDNKIETASMRMVVFADRSKIKFTQEDLAMLVTSGMKDGLTSITNKGGLSQVEFTVNSVNNDPLAVYNNEYKSKLPFPVKPNHLYFAINYQIITHYSESCYPACLDC